MRPESAQPCCFSSKRSAHTADRQIAMSFVRLPTSESASFLKSVRRPPTVYSMRKSVLIIVENAPVPFDTRVWHEATSLRTNGYDVTVLCPRGKSYEEGYAFIDGIHIYRHPLP